MLQAHSFLWNYLWVAPNAFLLALGLILWRRGLSRQFPAFLAFAILSSLGGLAGFLADILPSVSPENYWRVAWFCLLIESFLKFLVIAEIFSRVLNPYPSVSRLGRILVSGFGAVLVLLGVLTAALSRGDTSFRLISGYHLFEQTVFLIESGVILFVFLFAAYFSLSWDHFSFGLLLGFGISACAYLATWAVITNAAPTAHQRVLFDLLNMATYHACVLLWFYYLLVPGKVVVKCAVPLPENTLDVWNRELERLVHP
jgi:hypothetical protein